MVTLSKTIKVRSNGGVEIPSPVNPGEYRRLDENLVVPSVGKFVQIKPWNQLEGYLDNAKPYPEMFTPSRGLLLRDPQGREYSYVALPEAWQWFLWEFWKWASQGRLPVGKIERFYSRPSNYRTFAETTPGSLTYVYVDMVEAHRAFTEAGSPEAGSRDWVTERNLNAKDYEWLFNPTCNAMVKVIRTIGVYHEVEALDVLKPPPTIEWVAQRPWLYFWATQHDKYNGSTRFPQIRNANAVHGLPPAGTPSPLLSLGGTIKILKSSCDPLTNGQSWTPYRKL